MFLLGECPHFVKISLYQTDDKWLSLYFISDSELAVLALFFFCHVNKYAAARTNHGNMYICRMQTVSHNTAGTRLVNGLFLNVSIVVYTEFGSW